MVLPTTASFEYDAFLAGGSVSGVTALLGVPPVPEDVLEMFGCELSSDALSAGSPTCARLLSVGVSSGGSASVGPAVVNDGKILSVPVVATGSGYGAPPLVSVSGSSTPVQRPAQLRSTLKVIDANIINAGSGYVSPLMYFQGGLVPPQIDPATGFFPPSCVQAIAVASQGVGYSANAKVQFRAAMLPTGTLPTATLVLDAFGHVLSVFVTNNGQGLVGEVEAFVWDPGPTSSGTGGGTGAVLSVSLGVGQQATGTASLMGGAIHGISIDFAGGPYVTLPKIVIVDPTGSGAQVVPLMALSTIDVIDPGFGYNGTVTAVLEELFFALFPSSSSWSSVFKNLMTPAISGSVMSPVGQSTPILT